MAKILLDYVFPISVIESIAQASTAFLKQVAVVCKPKSGDEASVGQLSEHTSMTSVNAKIDDAGVRAEIQQLFNAGMSKVYILTSADLDLATYLTTHAGKFFTLLISSDFADEDIGTVVTEAVAASRKIEDITYTAKTPGTDGNSITINYDSGGTSPISDSDVTVVGSAITVAIEDGVSTAQEIVDAIEAKTEADALVSCAIDSGDETDPQAVFGAALALQNGADAVEDEGDGIAKGTYDGVIGVATTDADLAQAQGVISKRSAWFKKSANDGKNMFFAFGKLLSNLVNWKNQQYIEMPFNDDVDELGEAVSLFDDKVSFVINDDEFGNRLALFVAGGKAIVAPYILKNLRIDMQSRALQWIALNQPQYTIKEATLLETRIQEDVINAYVERGWIESGEIAITLQQQNFVASGEIEVPTPKALWRVVNEMTETT